MKNIILIVFAFTCFNLYAQVPQGIPYQAAARNANGQPLVNTAVKVRFSIIDSVATGSTVYQETHSVTTNNIGLFNVNVGLGTPVTGTFSGINWGQNFKFMKVELDPSGAGSNYVDMGTQQMMSVPYSLYSATSGAVQGSNIGGSLASPNIIIFDTPNSPGAFINWTVPSGITKIQVECWGAGGGGGSGQMFGGGGAYSKSILNVVSGSVHQIEVGMCNAFGGTLDGGFSRFDSSVIAFGGRGAFKPWSNVVGNIQAIGGTGVGQIVYKGQNGYYSGLNTGISITVITAGGNSPFGGFGEDSFGRSATKPGGGACGYGPPASGRVIITY